MKTCSAGGVANVTSSGEFFGKPPPPELPKKLWVANMKKGDSAIFDGRMGEVQSVKRTTYHGVPMLLVDVHYQPEAPYCQDRTQFYVSTSERVRTT